jgi:hypothetical protein
MENSFHEIAEIFNSLKAKFQRGEISRQEFIDEMKKLRIKDDQGRFWMIGAQTGKWYYFDGKEWVLADPPSQKEKKAICIYCGFENKIDAEVCVRCGGTLGEERRVCPSCGTPLQEPFLQCPKCGPRPAEEGAAGPAGPMMIGETKSRKTIFVLRAVQPLSSLLFGGILGACLGVIAGAFAGATAFYLPTLSFLPAALVNLQGKLLGAVIDGLLGGVLGFAALGAAALLVSAIMNLVLSASGGLKLNIGLLDGTSAAGKEGEERRADEAERPAPVD